MAVQLGVRIANTKEIKRLLRQVGKEALFAEKSALRRTGNRARTQYVRRMASKLEIQQRPIRSRTRTYGKKIDTRKAEVRQKLWVGGKRAITERDTPRVLRSPGLVGTPFQAVMPNGKRGTFVRAREWKIGPRNSYRRISRHYFKRPDNQSTYLPIEYPKLLLTTDESKRTLIDSARQMLEGQYPGILKKELETRIKRLRRKQARRRK